MVAGIQRTDEAEAQQEEGGDLQFPQWRVVCLDLSEIEQVTIVSGTIVDFFIVDLFIEGL